MPDKAFYAASGIQSLMQRWRVLSGQAYKFEPQAG